MDGISIDFYKKIEPLTSVKLMEVFTEAYSSGILPNSTRSSVMSLLHKKNDTKDIKNYKTLSLTNNDYNILSKALQIRMNPTMNHIIGAEQNGLVPSRFIAENNILLHEIIEHTKKTKKKLEDFCSS